MPVTFKDLPKEDLVVIADACSGMIYDALGKKGVAKLVIQGKLDRLRRTMKNLDSVNARLKKLRAAKSRNPLIQNHNRLLKTAEGLYRSALAIAEEYGLVDEFFIREQKGA